MYVLSATGVTLSRTFRMTTSSGSSAMQTHAQRLTRLQLYIYPIKGLCGVKLQSAVCLPQGLENDRRFMLFKVGDAGNMTKVQIDKVPQCGLFQQAIVGAQISVRYRIPEEPLLPESDLQRTVLEVPLYPDTAKLEKVAVSLHGSPATAYRMGESFDAWFSACIGFEAVLVYLGDGRRPVLGSLSPKSRQQPAGLVSSLWTYTLGAPAPAEPDWIGFQDVAPFLITTEASLAQVSSRLADGEPAHMFKFRPNVVVDGEDPWSEDFWGEITIGGRHRMQLTANCGRCSSIIVDYETGRYAVGEAGTVLKKLMKDRRVDSGHKWSPIFGRYAFLGSDAGGGFEVSVGDNVQVTRRQLERDVFDWPA